MAVSSVTYNKPVLPRVSDTSDLASNRASVYSGKALDFDGVNDSVSIPSSVTSVNITGNQLSIAGWFIHDGSANWQSIMYKDTGNNLGYQVFVDASSYFAFGIHAGGVFSRFSSSQTVKTNTWYFFTCTYDGASMKIYLNGAVDTSVSKTGNITSAASYPLYIGRNYGGSEWFNGRMSGIRIWDIALTATQVAELYNTPEQILPTGVSAVNLKLWLPMMEGAGSYVYNGAAGSLGEELVSNGTVDEVCQKWAFTDNGYVSATGGKLVWNAPNGSGANAVQYLNIVAGRTYRVTFDYSVNRDGFSIVLGNANAQPTQTGTGTYTVDLTPTSTNSGYFSLNMSGGTGYLAGYMDNISVKEVVPQATGTISGATWVAGQGEPLPQTALMDWNKHNQFLTQSSYVTFSSAGVHNVGTFIIRHIPLEITDNRYFVGYGANQSQRNRNLGQYSGRYWFVGWGSGGQDTTTTATIDLGKDTTVAYSWDENYRIKLYKNGAKFMDQTKTLSPVVNTNVYLQNPGDAYSSSTASSANNITIYLAMYNRVLSEEEINDVYNGVVSPDSVSGCVHYWENSRAWVDTVGSVNGNEVGNGFPLLIPKGLTTGKDIFGNSIVTPRSSGAFNFDGVDSSARITKNASLNVSSLSVEAWVYPKNSGYQSIFQTGNAGGGFHYYAGTSTLKQRLFINGSATNSSTYLTRNAWNHIVAVHDGATTKYYLNGALDVSTNNATGGANPMPLTEAWIGVNDSLGEDNEFQCSNVRLYNYVLTAEQVADNYNQKASTVGAAKTESELQAYINRTVAAGATVEDHANLLNTLTELDSKSGCL